MRKMILNRMIFIRHDRDFFPLVELSFRTQPNASFWKPISFLLKEYGCDDYFTKRPFVRHFQFNYLVNKLSMAENKDSYTPWFMETAYTRHTLISFRWLVGDAFCMAPSFEDLDRLGIRIYCHDGDSGKTYNYRDIPFEDAAMNPERYTFGVTTEEKMLENVCNSFHTIAVAEEAYICMEGLSSTETVTFHDYLAMRFKTEDEALDYCDTHQDFLGERSYEIREIKKMTII